MKIKKTKWQIKNTGEIQAGRNFRVFLSGTNSSRPIIKLFIPVVTDLKEFWYVVDLFI
jgi:hypothetical protein